MQNNIQQINNIYHRFYLTHIQLVCLICFFKQFKKAFQKTESFNQQKLFVSVLQLPQYRKKIYLDYNQYKSFKKLYFSFMYLLKFKIIQNLLLITKKVAFIISFQKNQI
ncbi:transmembrane protein, putative (macronuclear) [Tetrahymena thermophila SB210]|uniref:Transmembrane protein, putative n=1 Tax=Tetrahymena thermophila (strain SB210) TaxID=312017 RepID=W7X9R9_TETTS|nr:transmembrane protein, putative [Tetrahymena thermophila SB210]EWS73148.1 transmembrane protein, putative [Tetrahymena thermophila SB210]|eukprot:XP_012654335.1 transmembrane protein, putative [Tetrahymena thermophila SB210]